MRLCVSACLCVRVCDCVYMHVYLHMGGNMDVARHVCTSVANRGTARKIHVPGVVGIYRCLYEAYLNGSEEALLEALRSPKWVDT